MPELRVNEPPPTYDLLGLTEDEVTILRTLLGHCSWGPVKGEEESFVSTSNLFQAFHEVLGDDFSRRFSIDAVTGPFGGPLIHVKENR